MALTSDVLIQRLLDETSKGNEHLKAMKELLAGNSSKPQQTKKNINNKRKETDNKQFQKALTDVFGETKGLVQNTINGGVSEAAKSIGSTAESVGNALSFLPGPIGLVGTAFSAVASVSTALYDAMNEQLNMYNTLNSAGLSLSAGMITARKGSSSAFMSVDAFGQALTRNSDALAAMDAEYGNGVEHFGKLMQSIQMAQNASGSYGLSQQQLADITARNYKFNKLFGFEQQARRLSEEESTKKFVSNLNYLSKSVGTSVDELLKRFDSMSTNVESTFSSHALQKNFGFSDEQAKEVLSASNEYMASLGESLGSAVQQMNASRLGLARLPDEFNTSMLQMYNDQLENLQRAGVTDPKAIAKHMQSFVNRNMQSFEDDMDTQMALQNGAAAKTLTEIINYTKLLNSNQSKPITHYEDLMNRFNLWIGKEFTEPMNQYFTESQEKLASYLLGLSETTDNAWDFASTMFKDGYNKLNEALGGWLNAPQKIFYELSDYFLGTESPKLKAAYEKLSDSALQIPLEVAKTIWDWINGGEIETVSSGLRIAIKMFFQDIGTFFTDIGEIKISYEDIKTKIKESFQSMRDSVFEFWDKLTKWWNTDDTKAIEERRNELQNQRQVITQTASSKPNPTQKVNTPTEYTAPQKIEQPEEKPKEIDTVKDVQRDQREEDMKNLLSAILNTIESQGQQTQQSIAALRQIADNTEPARNV